VMANEWSPRRHRSAMVTIMACGFALGAAVGGLLASYLVPRAGWESVFIAGAIGTAVLAVAVLLALPESLRFLALRPTMHHRARIAVLLRRLDPTISISDHPELVVRAPTKGMSVVKSLFTEGRSAMTLLLWASFFMNMLVMNFLNNWLPTLLNAGGLPMAQAVRVTTLFQIGGIVGVVLMGAVADRLGAWRLVMAAYLASGVMVALIGASEAGTSLIALVVGLSGFCVIGVQMSLSALSATLYPTSIRSTGSSWALGIGRFGSSAGPLLGGVLVGWQWPQPTMFAFLGLFSLVGFCCVVMLARQVPRPSPRPFVAPHTTSA